MSRKFSAAAALAFLLFTFHLAAQSLPTAKRAEDLGFSSERLNRITQYFQSDIDRGAIPGVVLLVARDGKLAYFKSLGYRDREKKIAMPPDAIFRIASMSKPITTVAIMMLAEEGKIDLTAPASDYLPEFKDLKVGVEKIDPASGKPTLTLENPNRPPTVQDLLRHTSGIIYGPFGHGVINQLYNAANLWDPHQTLAEFVTKISRLPLSHQPGTVWEYGMSADVLGRVVEVVSGTPFDQFVAEKIAAPLRMPDTGFYLTPAQAARTAEPQIEPGTGRRTRATPVEEMTKENLKWFSGGGGMNSTATDYARFCQMLLNGGQLDGVRLLAPSTIARMTSDQLPPGTVRSGYEDLAPTEELGQSFGFGFAIRIAPGQNPLPGSVGSYFWNGSYGTTFFVDPREKMFAILMVQMPFAESGHYRRMFRELVYAAMVRSGM